MPTQKKVTVNGRPYDIDKLDDVAALQSILVPEGFPLAKREGVRLFLSLQNMAAVEMKRHLAHNFKMIVKTALDQQSDKEEPVVSVGFAFEINLSALTVAALGKTKMSFSRKYSTEGKPKTQDLAQGDFFDEDLSVVLNTVSLDAEMAPEPKAEKPKKEPKVKKSKVEKMPKPAKE